MTDLKLLATQALADRAAHTSQSGTVWRDEHYERAVFEREPALARGYLELSEALEERECDMHARIRAGYDKTVADAWRAEVARIEAERDATRAEVERLTSCLKRANAGTEHFEQAWNLAMDERDEAIAEVARLRRYEQCIVCDKPLVNDDCVEHGGTGVSTRKQLRDLSQEALSWQRRETEAIAQRDAARAALKEACEIVVDVCLHGTSPGLRATIAALRTRGGV